VRQFWAVPGSVAIRATVAVLVMAASLYSGVGTVVAAPASLDASFRDLPASLQAGDVLSIQVVVPSGASCDGAVTYRDGLSLPFDGVKENNGRCRWDTSVPPDARRGTADIVVNVKKDSDKLTLRASFEVTRQGDTISATFNDLPEAVKRNDGVSIRVHVGDGAICQGWITYDDGRVQALDGQTERKSRCKWDMSVPADAVYGPAKVRVSITEGSSQMTLAGSFEVAKESEGSTFDVGYRDLPATVRRDDPFQVRLLVPAGSTCAGSIAYFGVSPQKLDELKDNDGECRWAGHVPADAKPGNAEVEVTVKNGGQQVTTVATVTVDRASSDVDASFKSWPESIQREQTLEIRVSVPNDATCDGTLTFFDSDPRPLGAQSEHKERCLWEVDVPSNAPRGTATVRVTVSVSGDSTTLVGNVEVLNKGDITKASWADDLVKVAKPGNTFDVKVTVPNDSTCSGRVSFADGMSWALGNQDEKDGQCKWTVTVPVGTKAGEATVRVSVWKNGAEMKLSDTLEVVAR